IRGGSGGWSIAFVRMPREPRPGSMCMAPTCTATALWTRVRRAACRGIERQIPHASSQYLCADRAAGRAHGVRPVDDGHVFAVAAADRAFFRRVHGARATHD